MNALQAWQLLLVTLAGWMNRVVPKYAIARGGRTAGNKHRGISPFVVPTGQKLCAVSLCT